MNNKIIYKIAPLSIAVLLGISFFFYKEVIDSRKTARDIVNSAVPVNSVNTTSTRSSAEPTVVKDGYYSSITTTAKRGTEITLSAKCNAAPMGLLLKEGDSFAFMNADHTDHTVFIDTQQILVKTKRKVTLVAKFSHGPKAYTFRCDTNPAASGYITNTLIACPVRSQIPDCMK